jgi:hypothetical protein
MTPIHNGGLSKPVTLRVIQVCLLRLPRDARVSPLSKLFFAFACFAISVATSVGWFQDAASIAAAIGSGIAVIDASLGWHAITSKTAKKRNMILGWDFAGLVGLVAATVCLEEYNIQSVALTNLYRLHLYVASP